MKQRTYALIICLIGMAIILLIILAGLSRNIGKNGQIKNIQTKTISVEATDYSISIFYPFFGNAKLDAVVDGIIAGETQAFANDKPAKAEHGWKYQLFMRYVTYFHPRNIISMKFEVYTFLGGAHGTTKLITKVIDDSTGREYSMKNIFVKGSDYLKRLSVISKTSLTKKLGNYADAKWIDEGAGPKTGNYDDFVLTPKDIIIFFGQYQVASYAAGIQEVRIPLKELSGVVDPAFK